MADKKSPFKKLRKDIAASITADPFEDGAVIRWDWYPENQFTRAFQTKYTWAALRAGGRWYVTGQNPRVLDYEDLVELLSRDSSGNVQVATEWEGI